MQSDRARRRSLPRSAGSRQIGDGTGIGKIPGTERIPAPGDDLRNRTDTGREGVGPYAGWTESAPTAGLSTSSAVLSTGGRNSC